MHSDIDTPLYRLRLPRLTDAPAIFSNYASDSEVTRYMVWATHTAVETTEEFLADVMKQNKSDEGWTWSIVEPGSDECIGMIGVIPEDHRAEIGYVLSRRFWGLGIMSLEVREKGVIMSGWKFHPWASDVKFEWQPAENPNRAILSIMRGTAKNIAIIQSDEREELEQHLRELGMTIWVRA